MTNGVKPLASDPLISQWKLSGARSVPSGVVVMCINVCGDSYS